jgi:hypothetical protein
MRSSEASKAFGTTRSEADNFDAGVRKILSVSHDEIVKRDKEWHRKKAQKKRAKTSPASRVSGAKA